MLILLWLLTIAALCAAAAAWAKARRLAKRLERLTESYWELRYEHGQLRARVNRLDPEEPAASTDPVRASGATAFVPLSSLKR
ncbi:MAG TPA: hypothetical protein VH583_16025 [Vicinamibacterales bacterium]